jgi:hypothetical protein
MKWEGFEQLVDVLQKYDKVILNVGTVIRAMQ